MRLLKIVIPCLLLGGCVFGTSQNAKFYTQSALSTQTLSADFTSSVGVNRIQLPKYIERPQMVTQNKDSAQVTISEYNRWVESPSVLATRALVENLSALFPSARVKENHWKGDKFDRTVTVEISKLNAVLGDQAELCAWYMVKNKDGAILTQQKFTGTVQIGKTYDDLAQGCNQLLAQLSREIAGSLIQK